MSRSIIAALASVLRHPTCEPCVAWMCCGMSNSIKHAWACPDLSLQRWHRFLIAIMLLLVLRHPTCGSCVAWMCCRMSNSMKHVWACPDLSFDRLGLYTFLHCLRSNFSPSRPLPLWFEAAGTVTSTVPRYGHLRSNGFDWLKVFLQKNRKKGTLITSWYTLCGSA